MTSNLRKYLTKNPLKRKVIEHLIERIIEIVGSIRPPVLSDAGCGEGEIVYFLKNSYPKIYTICIDSSLEALRTAKKVDDRNEYVHADIFYIPLKKDIVDTTICVEVLEHLNRLHEALGEIKRVTKCHFIATVPNSFIFRLLNLFSFKNISNLGEDPEHIHHFTNKSLIKILSEHFEVKSVKHIKIWMLVASEKVNEVDVYGKSTL
jgi:ubiquinone/menaquinone biosynthesis C-methylase UbiE